MKSIVHLFLLMAVVVGAGALAAQPDINVQRGGVSIADGGTDNLGSSTGTAPFSVTYTIQNTGSSTLTLTGGTPITGSNPNSVNYTVNPPGTVTIAAASSTTFVLDLDPNADGGWALNIIIASDDADENPYNIFVTGSTGTEDDDDDCSTGTGSGPGMIMLAGLLAALAVALRLRLAR